MARRVCAHEMNLFTFSADWVIEYLDPGCCTLFICWDFFCCHHCVAQKKVRIYKKRIRSDTHTHTAAAWQNENVKIQIRCVIFYIILFRFISRLHILSERVK